MAKNTADGSGKKPVKKGGNKVHGEPNAFLQIFNWPFFTKPRNTKNPKGKR